MAKPQAQKKEKGDKQNSIVLVLTALVVLLVAAVGVNTWLLLDTRKHHTGSVTRTHRSKPTSASTGIG